ncbi:MAG: type II toxin-antitoxin system VapC family toxin [Bryobacteraceae bacterium]
MAKRKAVPHRGARGSGRTAAAVTDVPTIRYIESSALVAALLEGDASAKASIRALGQRITSAITVAETSRAVLRAHLSGRITVQQQRAALLTLQRFARRCHIVSVTETILAHAGRPFPVEPVRTLDAIHLATAEVVGEPPALVVVISRDRRVRDNATALGHPVE